MEESLFAPGHRACAGCGMPTAIKLVLDAAGPNTIVVSPTGCLEVTSTPFPESSWRVPWIHSLFENPAAVASGVEVALKRFGKTDINLLVIGGDGSTFDIGFGSISGMFDRGHRITYVCYDNEAYMNTGIQRSGATPWGAWTTTTPVKHFKKEVKKSIDDIVAAHKVPYQATASIAYPEDLYKKLVKAKEIRGFKFIHILAPCPPGWKARPEDTVKLGRLAVQTGVFPIYEVDGGRYAQTVKTPSRKPVLDYLKLQGRFKHLKEEDVAEIQRIVDARYAELEKRFQGC